MAVTIDGSAGVTTNAGGSVNPSTTIDGINYSCRSWVNFAGATGTIRASGNVTSVTKNTTADYTVNFTTAMTDANYAATGLANSAGNMYVKIQTYAAGSLRFITGSDSVNADATTVSIAIFR